MTADSVAAAESPARGAVVREAWATLAHLAFVAMFVAATVRIGKRDWNFFVFLVVEDGAIESLTAAFLLLTAATTHHLALGYRRFGRRGLATALWLGAAAFFVAGMEEISWGQRLFGIETPVAIAENNMQGELNLHNHPLFHGTNEVRGFLVVGAYGTFCGLAYALLRRRARTERAARRMDALRLFVVPVRFSPYFLALLVYIVLRRQDSPLISDHFPQKRLVKEIAECLFAIGCFLVAFYRLRTEGVCPRDPSLPDPTATASTSSGAR